MLSALLSFRESSDILPYGRVILLAYGNSDIETIGFSVIIFALNCPKDNNTVPSTIKLRSNKTRLWRIKLRECPLDTHAKSPAFFMCANQRNKLKVKESFVNKSSSLFLLLSLYLPAIKTAFKALDLAFTVGECNLSKNIRQTKRECYIFINRIKGEFFVFIVNCKTRNSVEN